MNEWMNYVTYTCIIHGGQKHDTSAVQRRIVWCFACTTSFL